MDIVIVDDDQTIVALLSYFLRERGAGRIIPFCDSVEALTWCEQNEPDLVIVDYQIPQLNGLQFIERFRAVGGRADIPLLMLTADQHLEVRHRALHLGANDFINKKPLLN